MKAIGYKASHAINHEQALIEFELPTPVANGHDLLVKINAIAVNPVDCKIRKNVSPQNDNTKVLGWDAVGEVVAVGEKVSLFNIGDQVFYAGDLNRQGCNAEFQLVDERIVGKKPANLTDTEAAALPLTTITAWELLFKHLAISNITNSPNNTSQDVILIVGAAGGVGSILVQLVNKLTNATIIATASRDSSKQWVKELGADYVVDHSKPLNAQISALNIGDITHVASLTNTNNYIDSYAELLAPFGKIALIDDPEPFDIKKLKAKSISLHWEFMFTRSMFQTSDMQAQGELLNEVSALIEQGKLSTTVGKQLGNINATNLKKAHAQIESGTTIGKIVLAQFD